MSAETYSGSSEEMPRTEMRAAISNNSDIAETNTPIKISLRQMKKSLHFDITNCCLSSACPN
ncbi:MAG: hypothetical protein ACLSA1_05860 [Alphaproteobacteria bacterium]